jgi:hypothetical protein
MTESYPPPYPPNSRARRPGGVKRTLFLGGIAFAAGLAAMAWTITHWGPARDLVITPQPAATVTPTVTPPQAAPTPAPATGAALAFDNANRAEGLIIAAAVRRAVDQGQSLGYLETALRQHFGATQPSAVAIIIDGAKTPNTRATLRAELEALTPTLFGQGPDSSWIERTRANFSNLIVFRNADQPSSFGTARIERAQRYLSTGQIDLAVAEIQPLPGAASAADWVLKANRLIQMEKAIDLLETAAVMVPPTAPTDAPAPTTVPPPAAKGPSPSAAPQQSAPI